MQTYSGGVWSTCVTAPCKGIGWSYSGGTWTSGKTPSSATYYVEGNATIGPTNGSSNKVVSVIATGNIDVNSSQAKLTPENDAKIQFACNGDLTINASDLDDTTEIEGQIFVRGQMDAGGSMEFQGRVMIQDVAGAGTTVANGATKFTYNGTLGAISTTTTTTTTGPTTYVNDVSGWIES